MKSSYVHGYDTRENARLEDQASTLTELLHSDTAFPAGSRVLEAGCGVGAQTVILAKNSPGAEITSFDLSDASIAAAKAKAAAEGCDNILFRQADIYRPPFEPATFDHVFVCFVLEHLPRPLDALRAMMGMLKEGGTITVIEGDHGSAYFHPDSPSAHKAIQALVDLQRASGGNAMIGRELYPLLRRAGFDNVRVSPRMVYADPTRPDLVEGFTKKTFTAMIGGVRDAALRAGIIDARTFEEGIADLHRTAGSDGVFCYTFFKAFGTKTR